MKRRTARELALKILFAIDLGKNDPQVLMEYFLNEEELEQNNMIFIKELVEGVLAKQELLDNLIKGSAIEWNLERMAVVERNLMRLALFEILFHKHTPPVVAVNEAIELAKIYGGENSSRFVNGILGKLIQELPEIESLLERS